MKRTALIMIFISILPAFCYGNTGPDPRLAYTELEDVLWEDYSLMLETGWETGWLSTSRLDLNALPETGTSGLLDQIHGDIALMNLPAPKDMVSMMSFVWAQMFGGVDIVAEVRDFARQVRRKGKPAKARHGMEHDSRNRWRFIVACRIDGQTEVAASLMNRGRLFGEGDVALEINTLDPVSEEIGLTMTISGGDLDIRADRMTLTEKAEARLVVKF